MGPHSALLGSAQALARGEGADFHACTAQELADPAPSDFTLTSGCAASWSPAGSYYLRLGDCRTATRRPRSQSVRWPAAPARPKHLAYIRRKRLRRCVSAGSVLSLPYPPRFALQVGVPERRRHRRHHHGLGARRVIRPRPGRQHDAAGRRRAGATPRVLLIHQRTRRERRGRLTHPPEAPTPLGLARLRASSVGFGGFSGEEVTRGNFVTLV